MKYCINKDVNKLIAGYVKAGWTYSLKGKHPRITHPQGGFIVFSMSPSDALRVCQNIRRDVAHLERTITTKEEQKC
jgi:predicted RNA binding protein YcfA (HicA-like mRNA interferase family)